jgi:hypothetical protein
MSLEKKLVRALVLMPLLRYLGDVGWIVIDLIRQNTPGMTTLWAVVLPAPLWYIGEIIGDTYLPYKAVAMVKDRPKWIYAIWGTFFTFAGGKIANTIFRFYALISGMGASPFYWSFSSYVDIYLLFTSIYVDIICCLAMYQTSKGLNLASKKLGDIMKLIKTSSLLRIGIMTCVKLLVGGYWLTTVCIEDYAICPTGWLRNITITVEYQLYYLDYLLTRNCSGVSEQTTKMTSITSNMSNS